MLRLTSALVTSQLLPLTMAAACLQARGGHPSNFVQLAKSYGLTAASIYQR